MLVVSYYSVHGPWHVLFVCMICVLRTK